MPYSRVFSDIAALGVGAQSGTAVKSTPVVQDKSRAPEHSRKALAGVRVLDLTNVLSGPFCAYQLGQMGADVIKVELPRTGDLARQLGADDALNARLMGASFLAQNGGKRSVTVNLKIEEGRDIVRRLITSSDVLVENFRPGVMERLGLGYRALSTAKPSLIYCAISGFGQSGPLHDAPAYDQIIQGLSGAMSVTGDLDCAPMRVGFPIADTVGGMTAAFAIAAALVRRSATGEGAFIDVSMLDSMIASMGWVVSNYLIAGQDPLPMGNDNFTAAPSGTFRTGEGLLNIAANKQEQYETLVRAVGRDDLAHDPRFAQRDARKRHRAALTDELESALSARTAAEWEEILNALGIPAGRVLTVPQTLAASQVRHRELLQAFDQVPHVDRPVTVTRAGFKLSDGDPDVPMRPPTLGEHTDEVLRELGYTADEIAHFRAGRAI